MFGCLLWAVVLAVALMIAWKAVPVKVASAKLYDYMEEIARFPGKRSEANIKKAILAQADELELPVEPEDVEVQLSRDKIKMKVEYTVPLEFPGYTYDWHFEHVVDRPIFIF
ncbi:MAG: hypothetical protein KDD11_10010 [Acidobacteria bacterium]|nr:hypothetical protein [Acidobacteriota bacterium]